MFGYNVKSSDVALYSGYYEGGLQSNRTNLNKNFVAFETCPKEKKRVTIVVGLFYSKSADQKPVKLENDYQPEVDFSSWDAEE